MLTVFIFFYEELCDEGAALVIWLLPWLHFKRGITDPHSFITGDVSKIEIS